MMLQRKSFSCCWRPQLFEAMGFDFSGDLFGQSQYVFCGWLEHWMELYFCQCKSVGSAACRSVLRKSISCLLLCSGGSLHLQQAVGTLFRWCTICLTMSMECAYYNARARFCCWLFDGCIAAQPGRAQNAPVEYLLRKSMTGSKGFPTAQKQGALFYLVREVQTNCLMSNDLYMCLFALKWMQQ